MMLCAFWIGSAQFMLGYPQDLIESIQIGTTKAGVIMEILRCSNYACYNLPKPSTLTLITTWFISGFVYLIVPLIATLDHLGYANIRYPEMVEVYEGHWINDRLVIFIYKQPATEMKEDAGSDFAS